MKECKQKLKAESNFNLAAEDAFGVDFACTFVCRNLSIRSFNSQTSNGRQALCSPHYGNELHSTSASLALQKLLSSSRENHLDWKT